MGNFLEDLRQDLINEFYLADGSELDRDVVNMVFARDNHQLGENARQMLEIGYVQDELVKMGFYIGLDSRTGLRSRNRMQLCHNEKLDYRLRVDYVVEFDLESVSFSRRLERPIFTGYYTSPTWQQDLLAAVQELIK